MVLMPHRETILKTIEQHLQELCVTIGERPVGSEENRKAQAYIGKVFQQTGYDVEHQEFDCIDWKGEEVFLSIGDEPVPAEISPYSMPCEVTAGYELVENIPHLEKSDLQGKIAVLHGDLTKEALMPKNFRFWNPEEHQRIIGLLEAKRPLALVTVSFSEDLPVPIIEDGDFGIPCAAVSKSAARSLLSKTADTIYLKINSNRQKAKGANVIARMPGTANKKKVVLTAHMDTKPGTPGALDNASGIVTLLTLGQLIQPQLPDFGLEFVALNGEDYYSNAGEIAYLDRYPEELPDTLLNINCDGVGLKGSKTGVSYLECPEPWVACFEQVRMDFPGMDVIEPWYQGDHMIFVTQGVPALTLTSSDIFSLIDTVVHTEKDTLDLLNGKAILEASQFIARVINECRMLG
jgi:aminopeptidase YwaD